MIADIEHRHHQPAQPLQWRALTDAGLLQRLVEPMEGVLDDRREKHFPVREVSLEGAAPDVRRRRDVCQRGITPTGQHGRRSTEDGPSRTAAGSRLAHTADHDRTVASIVPVLASAASLWGVGAPFLSTSLS
ncbi:hypothetical protein GCM10010304_64210 [Streptomyces roseoviolaceus]